jgi:hypothetical protein
MSEATLEDYERAKNMALSTNCEFFKSLTPEEQGAAKSHHNIVVNGKKTKTTIVSSIPSCRGEAGSHCRVP